MAWQGAGELCDNAPVLRSLPRQSKWTWRGPWYMKHPDCFIQTHLSENKNEIAYTLELYPEARDYLDVYQRYGLLSDKMLLGHSIHLEPREVAVMAGNRIPPGVLPDLEPLPRQRSVR
jgi:hypothetical protein